MPSLVLTGHPCTGKTSFAHLLAARALRHSSNAISRVIHISESTACPDRTKAECYSDSHTEKTTRAALKSEFDRAVMSKSGNNGGGDEGSGTLVILDSLNYIKGYRYELYCISKAVGERHGVVWIMGDGSDADGSRAGTSGPSDELAKKRNRERRELQLNQQNGAARVENEIDLDGYFEDDGTMDGLVLRYEPPNDKNRWESPLYKVDVTSVLPWGKDGTTAEVSSNPDHNDPASKLDEKVEERGDSLTSQIEAMEVKDSPGPSSDVPKKKSASGFKRRVRKSAPRGSSRRPAAATTPAPPAGRAGVPSSMASRNLTPGAAGDRDGGRPRRMEDVVDGLLDSFLTDTAPLREGMSTFAHVSADSDALNRADDLTRRVNGEILQAQRDASISADAGGRIFVALSSGGGDAGRRRAMDLSKPLYMKELRNFRGQFLKWIAGHPMPDGTNEEAMAEGYIAYIESHI